LIKSIEVSLESILFNSKTLVFIGPRANSRPMCRVSSPSRPPRAIPFFGQPSPASTGCGLMTADWTPPPSSTRHAPHPLLSSSRLRFKATGVPFRSPFSCASSSPFSSVPKASPLTTGVNWPTPGTSDRFPYMKSVKSPPPPLFLVRADTAFMSSHLFYLARRSPSLSCSPTCRRDVGHRRPS
jgi:hypothetical protein